ncbi:MAG: MATE family efflux transporter, partial [Ignavibacteria bacterium]
MQHFREHIKDTLILAYPVVIGQLGFIMMGVVDSLMVGEIGPVPLAAASLANSIVILIFIIGIGVAYAVTPLVAIEVGAKRFSECSIIFRHALVITIVLSILFASVIFVCSELLKYFNQPPEVAAEAESYTKIIGLSIIPALWLQTCKQFIEGFSFVRPAMIITLAANLVNAACNWILIFGKFGMPALGLDGAGLATLGSRIFMAAALTFYIMKSSIFHKYGISFNLRNIRYSMIAKILRIGLPSGFQYFFEVGAFSFAVIMIGWLGTKSLAAHQIAINLASISFMGALGISNAGGIRVGNAVGRQDPNETRKSGFSAVILGAAFMGISGLIFIIFRKELAALYINDESVITIASSLLIIAALFQVSDGVQAVGIGICRGLTDVRIPTLITFVAYWILALPVGYLFGFVFELGVQGVWLGFLAG